MNQLSENQRNLAVGLCALAGMIDVIAFASIGFFASFMSGNSTRLAAGMGGSYGDALIAFELILSFVGGVIAASLIGRKLGTRRLPGLLALIAGLLALTAAIAGDHQPQPVLILAAAMGMVNTLFDGDKDVSIGLTFMSGNLVRLGKGLARWIVGDGIHTGWLAPLIQWSAFIGGGMIGIGLFSRVGIAALWLAAGFTGALAAWTWGGGPSVPRANVTPANPPADD